MKILLPSLNFPPEVNAPAPRTFDRCREWAREGHAVTVVTCTPSHPCGQSYRGHTNRLFTRETVAGINVIRVWTYLSANEGFLQHTLAYVSYILACIVVLPWLRKADIVVSTSRQIFNGLAGYFVSRAKRVPWLLEIRDLWPESILAVGAVRNRHLVRVLQALEQFAYRNAAHIVPVTDAFASYIGGCGHDPNKITVIKNGVDTKLFDQTTNGDAMRQSLGFGERIVAAYFGTHGMAHHLETIHEAAALLKLRADIVFLLVGDGAERERLEQMRRERGLENVVMLGQMPKATMPELWAMADISLVQLRNTDLFKTVIPSKIFEAMGMATAILLGVRGEAQAIVESANAGYSIEPENAQELAERIVQLADNPEQRRQLGRNGHEYVVTHFDRRVLALRYLKLLESISPRRGQPSLPNVRRKGTNE